MDTNLSEFQPGDHVRFADEFHGTVEEVIWQRYSTAFLYLVEYWGDGQLRTTRLWESDMVKHD